MKIFSGIKVLEQKKSKFNGKVEVIKSLAWGTYIQVEGLTQSGGVVEGIWRSTLRKIRNSKFETRNTLILGLGGGTVAKLVNKFWPESKITGVDIDPVMVEMGKKHLGLDKIKVDIKIEDAYDHLYQKLKIKNQNDKSKTQKYDLIVVDIYQGYNVPEKFKYEDFISLSRRGLARGGMAVFNRLYYGENRLETMKFGRKLEKIFSKVEYFYPQANIMFICG